MTAKKMFVYSVKVYLEFDSGTQPSLERLAREVDVALDAQFPMARVTKPKVALLGQKKDELVDTSKLI